LVVTGESTKGAGTRGYVYSWGWNQDGQLGHGHHTSLSAPTILKSMAEPRKIMGLVAAGESHSGVIDAKCNVWTWGSGSYGRLGNGETIGAPTPRLVGGVLEDVKVVQLALGGWHSMALTSDMRVYAWGKGEATGLLREGDSTIVKEPRLVDLHNIVDPRLTDNGVAQIAAGTYHTILLMKNGDLYTFGLGSMGRLGNGDRTGKNSSRPQRVKHVVIQGQGRVPAGFRLLERFGDVAAAANSTANQGGQQTAAAAAPTASQEKARARGGAAAKAGEAQQGDAGRGQAKKGAEEEKSKADAAVRAGNPALSDNNFGYIQARLRKQARFATEAEIKRSEEDVVKRLHDSLKVLGDISQIEAPLTAMVSKFDSLFAKNLKYIKAGEPAESGSGSSISPNLARYQVLVSSIQQQVAYLVSLSLCLENEKEQATFYAATKSIFVELEDDRIQFLLAALLRLLVEKEIEQSKKLEDVLDEGKNPSNGRDRSSAFHLLKYFALHEKHMETIVNPLMDHRNPKGLMKSIDHLSLTQDAVWAVSFADFKKAPENSDKGFEFKELQSEFAQSTTRFIEFLKTDFVAAIKEFRLPPTVQKLLSHTFVTIKRRRFAVVVDGEVDQEVMCCEPIVKVLVLGILVPMLRNAKKFAGKMANFDGEFEKRLEGESSGVKFNIDQLANFLERMIADNFDSTTEGKLLKRTAKDVKNELIAFLIAQMHDATDDIQTSLLFSVLKSQYQIKTKSVQLRASVLMQLSNMFKKNMNKLSINDHDLVAEACRPIKAWTDEEIEQEEQRELYHTFMIDSRFLIKETRLSICPSSFCPVPPSLSTEMLSIKQQFGVLVRSFRPVEEHTRLLEECLVQVTCELKAETFDKLRKEFAEEIAEQIRPGRDIILANKLMQAQEKIQELKELDLREEELFESLEKVMANRKEYSAYLSQMYYGMRQVEAMKRRHEKDVQQALASYEAANRFQLTLQLPSPLIEAAKDLGVQLHLESAAERIQSREEFVRNANVWHHKNDPVMTYPMKKLLSRKVVVRFADADASKLDARELRVTFHLRGDGVDVSLLLKRHTTESVLQKFHIAEASLRNLQKSDEKATIGFPEETPVLVFSQTKLVEMLGEIAAN